MSISTSQRLSAARLAACQKMPYFQSAIFALIPRPTSGLGTLAVTDRCVLLYDPAVVDKWGTPELAWVLLHEVSHVLRAHNARKQTRDATAWNIAADAEINDDLDQAGARWPVEPVRPRSLGCADGLTAEEYYARSTKPSPAPKGGGKGKPGDKGEDPSQGEGDVTAGKCGGCAGNPQPGEAEADAEDGRAPVEAEAIRRTVAAAIQENVKSKGRGSVPAGLQRWADEQLGPPIVDWRSRLRRAARRSAQFCAGAVDQTYLRVSRRQAGLGYGVGRPTLAALHAPIPKVTVAIDTSGSMGDDDLAACLAELRGVLAAAGTKVTLTVCDADVHGHREIRSLRDVKLSGGGGTDFRPVFERIERERVRPDLLVFMTDGDGPAPASPPIGYRVLWVLIGAHARVPATWGECVRVERTNSRGAL